MKSWMTSLIGILLILFASLMYFFPGMAESCGADPKAIFTYGWAILTGAGFLLAKDFNATGGSK